MHYLSQALEWMRKCLFVRHAPRHAARTRPVVVTSPRPARCCLSPEMLDVALVSARHRRAPHVWPHAYPLASADDPGPGGLVRAYVLVPEERVQMLALPMREGR